jgi:hypothetical protein
MNFLWLYILAVTIASVFMIYMNLDLHKRWKEIKQQNEVIAKFFKITKWSDGTIPKWYQEELKAKN